MVCRHCLDCQAIMYFDVLAIGMLLIHQNENFFWALLTRAVHVRILAYIGYDSASSPFVHVPTSAEAPRIRLRDREERVTNLWGELAALNERLGGGDPVATRKKIDYLRCGCQGHMLVHHECS